MPVSRGHRLIRLTVIRWLTPIGAVALVFCAGCAPETSNEAQVLRFGLAQKIITLDPRYATDAASERVNRLLYRALVRYDDAMRPIADLAQWRKITEVEYRFVLAPGAAAFSNGRPLTAEDVKATYDNVLDPATGSPHRGNLTNLKRITVVSPTEVKFHLTKPDPLFPGRLTIGILPAHLIESKHPFNRDPVGSGGFRFARWLEDDRLQIQRRTDGLTVEFSRVADATVRSLKLIRGELDMIQNDLPPEMVDYLSKQENLSVHVYPGSNYAYLGFNLQNERTQNPDVRRAVAHAINRTAIIESIFGSRAQPATSLLAPNHWATNSELAPYPHDPVKAKQLLQQSGYNEQNPLQLTYKTSTNPLRVRLATIFQDQLAKVGIALTVDSHEWGTFYGDIKSGRFQLYSLAWVGIKSPDIFRYVFHSGAIPPEGANRGRLQDHEIDELIEQAEGSDSEARQRSLFGALQTRIHEILPYVPLWYEDHVVVTRQHIRDYTVAPDGNFDGLNEVIIHAH